VKKTFQQKLMPVILFLSLSAMSNSGNAEGSDPSRLHVNTESKKVVEQLYGYFQEGDMDKILSLLDPEVIFKLHGPEHQIPWAGTYKRHAGVVLFFSRIMATLNIAEVRHDQYVVDGEHVNVIGRDIGTVRSTGGAFDAAYLHSWHVRNGKILKLEEITDTAELINALSPADPVRGRAYFTTCAGCHGNNAEGNVFMRAPRLTLQGNDYLLRQLRHFREEIRGGVSDFYGWQMNGRAKALLDDRAIRDVLAYIDTLPDTSADDLTKGNTRKGRRLYNNNCSSCHGDNAEGSNSLKAPVLAGLEGWYQLEQLRKFKSGLRGAHNKDIPGQQMRAAMGPIKNEKAMQDIIKYINNISEH
jgi:cytochrome c553